MAPSEEECRRLVGAVKSSGALFAVAHVLRYAPHFQTIRRLVDDGKLKIDTEDEITEGTLITQGGKVVNKRILEAMGASSEGSE